MSSRVDHDARSHVEDHRSISVCEATVPDIEKGRIKESLLYLGLVLRRHKFRPPVHESVQKGPAVCRVHVGSRKFEFDKRPENFSVAGTRCVADFNIFTRAVTAWYVTAQRRNNDVDDENGGGDRKGSAWRRR